MSGATLNAADTLDALLRARHSCRAYLGDEIERSVIEEIVQTAGRVPSWCNAQPWQITICDKPETDRFRDALWDHVQSGAMAPDIPFPAGYSGAQKERRRACGWQLYEAAGIEKGDRAASAAQMMKNFRLFGAPHVAIVTTPKELGAYGVLDCGAFVTAFTLAAEAHGIASIPQAAVAGYAPFVRGYFNMPDTHDLVCAISFGLRDEAAPVNQFRTTRAPLDGILSWKTS